MLKTVCGRYHDGIIELDEYPADISEAQIIVTFLEAVPSRHEHLPPQPNTATTPRLKGLLSGREPLAPDTDPVRAALEQLRIERAVSLERCIESLLDGQGGS